MSNMRNGVPGVTDVLSQEFLDSAPPCDLLLAGCPCQPFSVTGEGEGVADRQGRGVVVEGILRYAGKHLPTIVVLENVKGLVARHREVLDNAMDSIAALGYVVSWKVLDMHIHGGVPCKRAHVYVVAAGQLQAASRNPVRSGRSQRVAPIAARSSMATMDTLITATTRCTM